MAIKQEVKDKFSSFWKWSVRLYIVVVTIMLLSHYVGINIADNQITFNIKNEALAIE